MASSVLVQMPAMRVVPSKLQDQPAAAPMFHAAEDYSTWCGRHRGRLCCAVICLVIVTVAIATPLGVIANRHASLPVVRAVIQSADTKKAWMQSIGDLFNSMSLPIKCTPQGEHVARDCIMQVEIDHTSSALNVDLRPDAWSPSNLLWLDDQSVDMKLVSNKTFACRDTLLLPVGLVMWRKMAMALGWPQYDITWNDIVDLALNPNGWAQAGYPAWGPLKFAQGNPVYSNSGRLASIAAVTAVSRGRTGNGSPTSAPLGNDQGWLNNATVNKMSALSRSLQQTSLRDSLLLDRMVSLGPSGLHAVVSYEVNAVIWNANHGKEMTASFGDTLAFVYLTNGTFWDGHPICVLDTAAWTTSPERLLVARAFQEFAVSPRAQSVLLDSDLRPLDVALPQDTLDIPLSITNGVLPWMTPATLPSLSYPSTDVLLSVMRLWHSVKKPATVILAIDHSQALSTLDAPTVGSNTDPSALGKSFASVVLDLTVSMTSKMGIEDVLYLVPFASEVDHLPFAVASANRDDRLQVTRSALLRAFPAALAPNGFTALRYGVQAAMADVRRVFQRDVSARATSLIQQAETVAASINAANLAAYNASMAFAANRTIAGVSSANATNSTLLQPPAVVLPKPVTKSMLIADLALHPRNYVLIIIADGRDTASGNTEADMLASMSPGTLTASSVDSLGSNLDGSGSNGIAGTFAASVVWLDIPNVVNNANGATMTALAGALKARSYTADTLTLASVFQTVASEF